MINKNPTIAIVDSGIGGVAVLRAILNKYKYGNYIYYADNLFMPYGNKSKQQIKHRIDKIISHLKENYNAEYIIIACNTASTCINQLEHQNVFTMKFNTELTYLATELTKQNLTNYNVISDKTLASKIEENIFNKEKLHSIIQKHIVQHKLDCVKKLVLGCTHYELTKDIFEKYMENSEIINNSSYMVKDLNLHLNINETNIIILTSKQDRKLCETIRRLLNQPLFFA